MSLSSSQKRYLRGLAHALKPIIMTGNKGVSPSVLKEFSGALDHHELVKVKLGSDDRAQRAEQVETLAHAASAEIVQRIGRVACFYRHNPERPRVILPA